MWKIFILWIALVLIVWCTNNKKNWEKESSWRATTPTPVTNELSLSCSDPHYKKRFIADPWFCDHVYNNTHYEGVMTCEVFVWWQDQTLIDQHYNIIFDDVWGTDNYYYCTQILSD